MVVLDATVVNVALPSIQRGLHFSAANLQWVVNAYTLIFGGFLLLGGRAADLLGPQAAVRRRGRPVLGRLAAQRARPVLGDADRRARPPGSRRRARLPRRAVDHHHHVHRRQRADPGARRVERDRGRRRRGRPAARRRPHRPRLVAVDLLRQRPGRRRHRSPLALRFVAESRVDLAHRSFDLPAPSRSPPAWSCSCTRSSRPRRGAGARRGRSAWAPSRSRCWPPSWRSSAAARRRWCG